MNSRRTLQVFCAALGLLSNALQADEALRLQLSTDFDPVAPAGLMAPPPSMPARSPAAEPPSAARPASTAAARDGSLPASREQRAEDEFRRAGEAYLRGDAASAESAYQKALEILPAYHTARSALAALLFDQGRFYEASSLARAGLDIAPGQPALKQIEARVLMAGAQDADALKLLLRDPPPLHAEPAYHALIAALFLRQNQPAAAAQIYRGLVQAQPRAAWWAGLGLSEESLGNPGAARHAYQQARAAGGGLAPALSQHLAARLKALGA